MPRERKIAEDRRVHFLVETLRLIEEKGIDRVRSADVSERLGVSAGLIFYHFDNLQTLVAAAITYATEREMATLHDFLATTDGDVLTRLRAALHEYGPTGAAFGWRLWIECWSASLRDAELRSIVATLDSGWRAVIGDLIKEGVAGGAFDCLDPESSALRLTALLDGLAVQHVVFEQRVTSDQIDAWMDLTMRRELSLPPAD